MSLKAWFLNTYGLDHKSVLSRGFQPHRKNVGSAQPLPTWSGESSSCRWNGGGRRKSSKKDTEKI